MLATVCTALQMYKLCNVEQLWEYVASAALKVDTKLMFCGTSYSQPIWPINMIQLSAEQPSNSLNTPPYRGLDQINCTHVVTLFNGF
jgi:hypothetical protein